MKILAVIPARAGSKGIPNKNIRIINGKPLISYCIENALRSKYITDIVITTDSVEIELIAKKYKVAYIHRKAELCEDAVTLDAVVYDACKGHNAEWIVTMQPTSPTLRHETLDNAIEYAIKNNLDTLISGVNRPHLAWIEKNGRCVPAYEKRLNRQYLPKRYIETGAFVVSKVEIVTKDTRIGDRVGIYEISQKEAVDIDTFEDLVCAEQILKEKKIAIIVNGNNDIGLGHISRALELADMFYYKPDIYYDISVTSRHFFGNTTYPLFTFDGKGQLLYMLKKKAYQIIINDILDTDVQYIDEIRENVPQAKIVNFEDLGTGRNHADLVINALYKDNYKEKNVYFGEKYYLVPKLFLLYNPIVIHENVKRVLVCFGGADPQNYTEKVLHIIRNEKYHSIQFVVILGKAKMNVNLIMQENTRPNIDILYDIKNIPEIMEQSDLAITSRGRTCFELAVLGIPTIAMAQNERETLHEFAGEENGFRYLGTKISEQKICEELDYMLHSTKEEREKMQKKMLSCDLVSGRERIRNLIDSI